MYQVQGNTVRMLTARPVACLAPANVSFQQWQVNELEGIQAALARATGH